MILRLAAFAAVLLIVWLTAGRCVVTALDSLHTTALTRRRPERLVFGSEHAFLNLADRMRLETDPRFDPVADPQGRVTVHSTDGGSFALGTAVRDSTDLQIEPSPEDSVWFETRVSAVSWPSLFDFNFMTGHSPSKKRNRYYRLIWTKPGGASLEMVWRYEQWFYDQLATDWSDDMTAAGTGLIRYRISGAL